MNFKEFQKFIDDQDAFFKSIRDPDNLSTEREHILMRTVKISEEFGELCDEVLAHFGKQRKGKMDLKGEYGLSDEFADVIITVFMLAKSLDISIPEALARKTEKIKNKHNKELKG